MTANLPQQTALTQNLVSDILKGRFGRPLTAAIQLATELENALWLSRQSHDVAERELAGLRAKVEWQPIEAAPKGRKIIVGYQNALGNWRTVMARYYLSDTLECEDCESGYAEEGWYEESESHGENLLPTDCPPTRWQPLPEPPRALQPLPAPSSKSGGE